MAFRTWIKASADEWRHASGCAQIRRMRSRSGVYYIVTLADQIVLSSNGLVARPFGTLAAAKTYVRGDRY
jgi:hypothetical protein